MAEQETAPTTRQQTPTPTSAPTQAPSGGGLSAPRVQLKRGVQMMGYDAQAALLAPDAAIQKSGGADGEQVHQAAAHGIASGGGAMPHGGKIQQAFGSHDVSGIQAHTGGAAKEANQAMGAEAYATGNHIAFGQSPDLHTAAHEAAHVIQQEHGVSLSGGVGKVGDAYENHADKVADAVVSGKSAEPILNEMTGGGGGGGGATQKKAIQLMASSDPVQMIAPTPPAPAPRAPTPTPAPAPTPEEEWRTYCDTLEAQVKAAALLITSAEDREAFKKLNPVEMRTYSNAEMVGRMRSTFLGFDRVYGGDGWKHRTAITVMMSTAPHFTLYKSLTGDGERQKFREITPDERGDLLGVSAGEVTTLLTDEAALNRWRTWRNSEAVKNNHTVMAALGAANPDDLLKVGGELEKLSQGPAGERMRRLITEQGFENPDHKNQSIRDVANMVQGGMDAWAGMQAVKQNWILKGKLSKAAPGFKKVPVLKAIAHSTMVQYGTLSASFLQELKDALNPPPAAGAPAPAAAPAAFKQDKDGPRAFRAWKALGGAFNPSTHVTAYSIEGRGKSGAYWMFSATMTAVCDEKVDGMDVIKRCAIEESPEYNDGFCIVELPTGDSAAADTVRRPTMWDGLQFDQFAGVDDANQCYGVTSGGTPEVVVAPTPFGSCVVKRNVSM